MTKILYSSFVILWAYYGLTFEGLTLTKILYNSFVIVWAYYGLTFDGLTYAYYVISSRFFWIGLLLNYILCSYVCLKLYVRANKILWRVFFFVFSCMWIIIWALLTEATLKVVSPGAPGVWWLYLILWQSPAKGPRSPHTGYVTKPHVFFVFTPSPQNTSGMSQVSTNVSWS